MTLEDKIELTLRRSAYHTDGNRVRIIIPSAVDKIAEMIRNDKEVSKDDD